MNAETYATLEQGCAQLNLRMSSAQLSKLHAHLTLLEKWSARLNLTAVAPKDMAARHTLDSLAILRFIRGARLLDIGSGGGFPGLPLAIAAPQLQVTLLESRGKRAAFLRAACAELKLSNVAVAHSRIQDARADEKFDTLATRAFAPLDKTIAAIFAGGALHHRNCRLLAMKGQYPARELRELPPAFRARARIEKYRAPFLNAERHLVIIPL